MKGKALSKDHFLNGMCCAKEVFVRRIFARGSFENGGALTVRKSHGTVRKVPG